MSNQDPQIMSRIGELVDEEHRLRTQHIGDPLSEPELNRLRDIEVQLDQCWDLLNQRRALREFGMDPGQASVRDEGTVEGYKQ